MVVQELEPGSSWQSLKILLRWMALIGIDLPQHPVKWMDGRILVLLYGLVLFSFDIALMSSFGFLNEMPERISQSTTGTMTAIFSYMNWSITTIIFHGSLLYLTVSGTKWERFRETVNHIDRVFHTDRKFCDKFRSVSIVSLFLLFVLNVFFLVSGLTYAVELGFVAKILHATASLLGMVYLGSIEALMWVTGWILACYFQRLALSIEEEEVDGAVTWNAKTHVWKRQYAAVCDGVRRWNTFFDVVLLTHVCNTFTEVIVLSFFAVDDYFGERRYGFVFIFAVVLHAAYLWITCFIAHAIYDHSEAVHRALIDLECRLGRNQWQVQRLAEQAHRSRPTINACGYFRVHRNLFPSLVGTCLTYLIILYQFKSSERIPMNHQQNLTAEAP